MATEISSTLLETISNTLPALGLKLPTELISLTNTIAGAAGEMPTAQEATAMFAGRFTGMAINLGIAIAILAGGWIFSKWFASFATRNLMRTKMEETAAAFLGSTARYIIVFITIMIALASLGVTRTGMLAVLGAAGLAIGLALKDFLAHIAAGIMLMITQPFRVGQFITCGDFMGTVKRITLFNTEINTLTNQRVFMPNGMVFNNTIINHNYNQTRQVEVWMRASLDDDIASVIQLYRNVLKNHPLIRNEPEPFVGADSFFDNGVLYVLRCWVQTSDWGAVRFSIMGDLKLAMESHGFSVPYPQQVTQMRSKEKKLTTEMLANRKRLNSQMLELRKEAEAKQHQKEVALEAEAIVKQNQKNARSLRKKPAAAKPVVTSKPSTASTTKKAQK